jgi:hypothetical protein
VLAALERLDNRLTQIEARLARVESMANEVPRLLGAATDTFDDLAQRASDAGIEPDERARNLLRALERLTSQDALSILHEVLSRLDVVRALLEYGVFDPGPVGIISRAGEALVDTAKEAPAPVGAWGVLRALGDPHIQRALGFALRFAQRFGAALPTNTAAPPALSAKGT